jgi:nuclear pore complex protein Nup62
LLDSVLLLRKNKLLLPHRRKSGLTIFELVMCSSAEKKDAGDKPAAAPATSSLFGGFGAPAGAAPAASKPAAPTSSLFGGAPSTSASTSTATATAPPPKPSAGSSNLNPNNQATKTVALGEQAPSFVKGKTFNEIVERFEQELGTQVKTFKDQAAEVREWDLVLMQNASSVSP